MLKKILIPFAILAVYAAPLNGQSIHVGISYQSFRPFIHFQLEFDSNMYHSAYRTAYLKGYMDGVNSNYYYDHRFQEMVENMQIYKAGYRDGMRDRALLIQLRGRAWMRRHRFTRADYYSPYTSVRVWLEGLTIAFLKAPARRLPPGWRHRIPPQVRRYRNRRWHSPRWNRRRYRREDYDDYEDRYEEHYEYEEEFEEYEEEFDD